MTFSGTTADVCPPDGLGTSYYLLVDVTEVALDRLSGYKALDTNGCGNGRSAVQGGTMTTAGGRKIVRARAVMCFTNDGNPCWSVPEPGVWKDNPHHP